MVQRPIRPHLCLTSGPLMDQRCCMSACVCSIFACGPHFVWEGGAEGNRVRSPCYYLATFQFGIGKKNKKKIQKLVGLGFGQSDSLSWGGSSAVCKVVEFSLRASLWLRIYSFPAHSWGIPLSRSSWPRYPSTRNCTYTSTKVLFRLDVGHFESATQLNRQRQQRGMEGNSRRIDEETTVISMDEKGINTSFRKLISCANIFL